MAAVQPWSKELTLERICCSLLIYLADSRILPHLTVFACNCDVFLFSMHELLLRTTRNMKLRLLRFCTSSTSPSRPLWKSKWRYRKVKWWNRVRLPNACEKPFPFYVIVNFEPFISFLRRPKEVHFEGILDSSYYNKRVMRISTGHRGSVSRWEMQAHPQTAVV